MRVLRALLGKEYRQIFRDRVMVLQIFIMPVIQLLVLANAATFEVKSARLYVVDQDRSVSSRGLVNRFLASGRFQLTSASGSMAQANDAMLGRDAGVILQIPRDFEERLVRQHSAPVQLILNAEDGAAAGVTQSYAASIIRGYAAELAQAALTSPPGPLSMNGEGETISSARPPVRLSAPTSPPGPLSMNGEGETISSARPPVRLSAPLDVRTRNWYNPSLDYRHYMVPGILVFLITLVGTLLTALNIAREKEIGTLDQLNVTPVSRSEFIAAKLIPLWSIALVELGVGLLIARFVFGVPMLGSIPLVFALAAVYLFAALGTGLWVSTIAATQQQAMFITFFIMVLYLLMSGLFTPISSMPEWAQWIAQLNPVKHFVWIMRAIMLKGAGFRDVLTSFAVLSVFAAGVFTLAVRQYSKRSA